MSAIMLCRQIQRTLAMDNDELILAACHCEGWLRREGLLTPEAYRVLDEHVWEIVDALGVPDEPQPCGWSWDGISRSSRGSREKMAQYLRSALRHHLLWREAKPLRH